MAKSARERTAGIEIINLISPSHGNTYIYIIFTPPEVVILKKGLYNADMCNNSFFQFFAVPWWVWGVMTSLGTLGFVIFMTYRPETEFRAVNRPAAMAALLSTAIFGMGIAMLVMIATKLLLLALLH